MSLQERIERMDKLHAAALDSERISRLAIAVPGLCCDLAFAPYFNKRGVTNPSPNGILSPERNSSLEYNLLVRNIVAIVDYIGVGDLIDSWSVPMYVRFKGKLSQHDNPVGFQSELPHVDPWSGEQPAGHRLSMYLTGDVENNYVDLFDPPDNFDESWLAPLPSYEAGQHLVEHFRKVEHTPELNTIYIADMCMVHQTVRKYDCDGRISLDVSFLMKGAPLVDVQPTSPSQKSHKARMSHEQLRKCGTEFLFWFDSEHNWTIKDLT